MWLTFPPSLAPDSPPRCEHQVGKLSDKLDAAHTELGKVVWSADRMSNTMPRRHHLRWAMDIIDESIKKAAVAGVSPANEDGDSEEYDYEDINVRGACLVTALVACGGCHREQTCLTPLCFPLSTRHLPPFAAASTAQSTRSSGASMNTCSRLSWPSTLATSSAAELRAGQTLQTGSLSPRCARHAPGRAPS